jgi:hypothetical protein
MYPGDSRGAINARLFDDPRVTTFWDPHEISGRWLGSRAIGGLDDEIVWDAFYAFAPATRWSDRPDHLIATGAPIIGGVDALERAFLPLLKAR